MTDPVRKRIRQLIGDNNLDMKSLSLALGKNHAYLQQYLERGIPKELNERSRLLLAEQLGVDEAELGAPQGVRSGRPAVRAQEQIPEIDVHAGAGGGGFTALESHSANGMTFSREVVRDHWRLPDWLLYSLNAKPGNLAAFPVQGDSMSPTLLDGDVVFVDTRIRQPSPPGLFVLADEFGGVIVKRLEVSSGPGEEDIMVRVGSDNPHHMTKELRLDEISIVGRYVGRFTR
ncbi:MAG: S24 family peptidase [Pseudomonadota bacterium]